MGLELSRATREFDPGRIGLGTPGVESLARAHGTIEVVAADPAAVMAMGSEHPIGVTMRCWPRVAERPRLALQTKVLGNEPGAALGELMVLRASPERRADPR